MSVESLDIHASHLVRTPNFTMAENHFHSTFELFYLHHGQCRFFVHDRIMTLKAGDLVLIAPCELHHTLYFSSEPCERTTIYFSKEHLMENCFVQIEDFATDYLKTGVFTVPAQSFEGFHQLLGRIVKESSDPDVHSKSLLQCYLTELFLFLVRTRECRMENLSSDTADMEITAAAQYICENFKRQITLEQVASVAGLSPTYFSRKFKSITGLGFKEYLNFVRLKSASTELLATDATITSIALNNGFNDSNYFKDIFKKTYGVSPRSYRKQQES